MLFVKITYKDGTTRRAELDEASSIHVDGPARNDTGGMSAGRHRAHLAVKDARVIQFVDEVE